MVGRIQNAALVGSGELPALGTRYHFGFAPRQHRRRRRFGRTFSRPDGSLRYHRICNTLLGLHLDLELLILCHTHLYYSLILQG